MPERREYHLVADKLAWGRGPWVDEPDKAVWVDAATGYDAMALRNPRLGHWCGYVGVPEGHRFFGEEHELPEVAVHGGLTFADRCAPGAVEDSLAVCHTERDGVGPVWWFGFDCAHLGDLTPSLEARMRHLFGEEEDFVARAFPLVYRDLAWVEGEVAGLAAALAVEGRDTGG